MDSGKSWDVAEAQRPGIEKREGALLDPKRAKTFVSIEGVCVCVCVCVASNELQKLGMFLFPLYVSGRLSITLHRCRRPQGGNQT